VDGNLCALGGLAALQRAASSFGETDSEERRAETFEGAARHRLP